MNPQAIPCATVGTANQVQMCRLLSVKTGGCPEDCAYCPQSAHYQTGVKPQRLMETAEILSAAQKAKALGFKTMILGTEVEGESKDIARFFAAIAREIGRSGNPIAVITIARNTAAYPGITCERPPNSATLRVCLRS